MKEVLQLTFRTSHGRNRVLSINDPRAGINATGVGSAASMMMTANPFNPEVGQLVSLVRAQRVSVSRDVVIAPAV
jgi:hypothetical protein